MIFISLIVNIMAFVVGWMTFQIIKSWFGLKTDWTTQWLTAIIGGIVFAFLTFLIK